ncbi:hypothetical protein ABPG74_008868 [Tetrahymena malaccensis]
MNERINKYNQLLNGDEDDDYSKMFFKQIKLIGYVDTQGRDSSQFFIYFRNNQNSYKQFKMIDQLTQKQLFRTFIKSILINQQTILMIIKIFRLKIKQLPFIHAQTHANLLTQQLKTNGEILLKKYTNLLDYDKALIKQNLLIKQNILFKKNILIIFFISSSSSSILKLNKFYYYLLIQLNIIVC